MCFKSLKLRARNIQIGCRVVILPRFAVGAKIITHQLQLEADFYGDLAILNMTDTFISSGQNSQKTWLSFRWALQRHGDAHLIFHQDGDTLVDWRQALPRFLKRIFPEMPPEVQELRQLQFGRLCSWDKDSSVALTAKLFIAFQNSSRKCSFKFFLRQHCFLKHQSQIQHLYA